MPHAALLAATSTLGRALARQLAAEGYALTLLGRNESELARLAADVKARHGGVVSSRLCDLADGAPSALLQEIEAAGGPVDLFISLPGLLDNGTLGDADDLARVTLANYLGPARFLGAMAVLMQPRGHGTLVAVSSVAGDRGRGSNHVYGAAKAALSTYADGLRNRLFKEGVQVMTVKPGFMASPMTDGMKSPLIASPERVAAQIIQAVRKKRGVVYTPWFWRWIMAIIRFIPDVIFKRLSL